MSGYTSIDIASSKAESSRAIGPESVLRGSALEHTIYSGSPAIAGSPAPADFAQPEVGPQESLGAFRGIAWSLLFEGAAAAAIYALFQVWKIVR